MIKLKDSIKVEDGIYYNVPHEEYRKWDCFSYSMVRATLVSQKELDYYINTPVKESDQMLFGNLLEMILLEPDLFDSTYVVAPVHFLTPTGRVKDTKESRPWVELQKSKGLQIITPDIYNSVHEAKKGVLSNTEAFNSLQDCKTQVSIVWTHESTGVQCKGRIDILREDEIIDLKTTDSIDQLKWSKKIHDFKYHVQAAMYCDGYQKLTKGAMLPYNFIVAQNRGPYDCVFNELDEQAIITGRCIYEQALAKYKAYQSSEIITGYSNVREPINVPLWALIDPENHEVI